MERYGNGGEAEKAMDGRELAKRIVGVGQIVMGRPDGFEVEQG